MKQWQGAVNEPIIELAMTTPIRTTGLCVASLVAAGSLLAGTLFLALAPRALRVAGPDYDVFYRPVAASILAGRGLVYDDGSPAIRIPPGYPVWVAGHVAVSHITGIPEQTLLTLTNLLLLATSTVLVYVLASRFWGARAALSSAALWATYPLALSLVSFPSSELPFIVLVLLALTLLWRGPEHASAEEPGQPDGRAHFLAGLLIGTAMLVRPAGLGLGLVLSALILLPTGDNNRSRRWRTWVAVLFLCGTLVIVGPWEVWVYATTGRIVPLCTTGTHVMRDGLTFGVRPNEGRTPLTVPRDVHEVMESLNKGWDEGRLETTTQIARALIEQAREHPLGVLHLFAIKVGRNWYGTYSQRYEKPLLALQLPYMAAIAAATVVALRRTRKRRTLVYSAWAVAACFWAVNVASSTLARYFVPAMPVLFLVVPALLRDGHTMADSAP